jgi:hypothetical protein
LELRAFVNGRNAVTSGERKKESKDNAEGTEDAEVARRGRGKLLGE